MDSKAELYKRFVESVLKFIPKDRIYTDELRRFAWGTDAGCYRLVPQVVIRSKNENEISRILELASDSGLPVTFRAAGTSLSGQSISDSIIIVAGKSWEKYHVNDNGMSITMQPGLIGDRINRILAPYGRKFGPDPASIKSCMAGGIVMNNASGMSCGTVANSDRLMKSARIILADGSILDTADASSRKKFYETHKQLVDSIAQIRDEIRSDKELYDKILYKYSIKNVTGLNIRPFAVYDDPFEIICHLMAGSEGTLAFLSEVTMETVPVAKLSASGMVYFDTLYNACHAAVILRKLPVSAAELFDSRSLASVHDETGAGKAALLIKIEADDPATLEGRIGTVTDALHEYGTALPFSFSTDSKECARLWALRAGIFPTVGSMRKEGTTCIIEDIAFHIEDLPDAVDELSVLLDKHNYTDSCIYGHVLAGNVHFIINQFIETDEDKAQYKSMLEDIVELVTVKYGGSLKAEHGTGRNMAPFVAAEWGEKAYEYMKRVKHLFDPGNILNPGVIINDDPDCCYTDFKHIPIIRPRKGASEEACAAYTKANRCIECGFCEVNCMSCGFTLSSRTRIVTQREIAWLEKSGEDPELLAKLRELYKYYGEETCAGDGLCSTSCPMGINVADITHEIRRKDPGTLPYKAGDFAAIHFAGVKKGVRATLNLAEIGRDVLGRKGMELTATALHKIGLPLWTESLPFSYKIPENISQHIKNQGNAFSPNRPAGKLKPEQNEDALKVVYCPSCINQTMGIDRASKGMKPLAEETIELFNKAGYEVIFPENKDSLCCGTIWESKGMADIADRKSEELEEALFKASEGGKYPVVCDQSPCVHRMKARIHKVKIYDSVEFIWEFLKDRLLFTKTEEPVAIHITCSTRLMKLDKTIVDLAHLCTDQVLVPEGVGCCGFAGDKGMTTPELNAYGLRNLRSQITDENIHTGYSNSRTCEIGLQTNSGIPYRSIIYLVNKCTVSR